MGNNIDVAERLLSRLFKPILARGVLRCVRLGWLIYYLMVTVTWYQGTLKERCLHIRQYWLHISFIVQRSLSSVSGSENLWP